MRGRLELAAETDTLGLVELWSYEERRCGGSICDVFPRGKVVVVVVRAVWLAGSSMFRRGSAVK